jgi:uncharacterized repeat protein (TIGR01451 family)
VTIATSAASVPSAQQLTYTVEVKNNGSQAANNVKLYNTLGLDVTVLDLSATKANGRTARCDVSADNDAVCDMDRVPADPNVSAQLQIDVVVNGLAGNLGESSTVHSGTSDTDMSDNSGSAVTEVTDRLQGVTITTTDHVAYETDANNKGQFSVCRYESRPSELVVNFQTAVTPTPTDHEPLGSRVTIGAGTLCGTIPVTATADTRDEGPEFVAVTLAAGNGYTVDPRKATAEVGIVDAQRSRPIVTITATDPTASESGDNTGKFTVTRTTSFHSSLTVFLTASGTATVAPGVPGAAADVQQAVAVSVQIPANSFGPSSVEITVRPVQDSVPEGPETLVLTIDERATYQVGNPGTATVTIHDDDAGLDTLHIKATDKFAFETKVGLPLDTGTFEITRQNTNSAVTVSYVVRNAPGDATPGADYTLNPSGGVTLPVGVSTTTITVQPIDDMVPNEPPEPVVVTLNPVSGVYNVDPAPDNTATVTILDNDCVPGLLLRRVTHNGDRRGIPAGTQVTFTAALKPRDASVTASTWEFAELLSVTGRIRHYGPWQLVATTNGNTLTTPVERSGQYRVTLAACGNPTGTVSVTVTPRVTSLEWVEVRSPLTPNDHPEFTGGVKMYPDLDTPNQSLPLRNRWVSIEATVQPAQAGLPVYFKVFDVDDPDNHPDVDPNGSVGDDNFGSPRTGSFPDDVTINFDRPCARTVAAICKLTDANGKAKVGFQVTMQPGDNFRAAATLDESKLRLLHVGNPSTAGYVYPNDSQVDAFKPYGTVSEMLTVWRRLWIEVDSMAAGPAIPSTLRDPDNQLMKGGAYPTASEGQWEDNTWSVSQPQPGQMTLVLQKSLGVPANFYAGGYIESSDGSVRFEILSNTDYTIVVAGEGTISQRNKFVGQATTFWVVDDDERIAISGFSPLLPRYNLITAKVREKFEPAYITLVDVNTEMPSLNPEPRQVPFQLNTPGYIPLGDPFNSMVANDRKSLQDKPDFWVHLVVAGYQGLIAADKDPDNEIQTTGESFDRFDLSIIYLETIRDSERGDSSTTPETRRDNFVNVLCGTVAHEIGHMPARRDDHPEGGLQNNDSCTVSFKPKTRLRFRKTPSWQAEW